MRTTPSDVAILVRRYYPQLAEQTNIGSRLDATQIAGIVDAVEAIPEEVIPRDLRAPMVNVRGRLRNAVRTWESRGTGGHYLSGRDLLELLGILARCPDAPPAVQGDAGPRRTESERPLVFISCGQYTDEEIGLGSAMERLVREETKYDAYFAEQQNSLDGLSSNILSSLGRCAAFVGVAHHRGVVDRLKDRITRASVWVEQEIAIAAFIQHALKRKIEVALYLQKGIHREGIREQLRLAPIEFETPEDVLKDFRSRLSTWNLEIHRSYSLIAEWRYEKDRIDQKRHDYRFRVDLVNNGSVQVNDWKVRLDFPRQFLDGVSASGRGDFAYEENSTTYSTNAARLYPGDRLPSIVNLSYHVDESNWDSISDQSPIVRVSVWSGDMPASLQQIPMSRLNIY